MEWTAANGGHGASWSDLHNQLVLILLNARWLIATEPQLEFPFDWLISSVRQFDIVVMVIGFNQIICPNYAFDSIIRSKQ